METTNRKPVSTVYGPVRSWRVGMSLGIDLIRETSVCSFNCVYCQLGNIQVVTNQRELFVATEHVVRDFLASRWRESDIITYSGSGEPTLALNLGEAVREIGKITDIPQLVLTNGTRLDDPDVIQDLQAVQRVYVKLDAASEEMFQRINRPVNGITLASIVEHVKRFKKEYGGMLGIQVMFMPLNRNEADRLADILSEIHPDEVQLNTPTRPYPRSWHIASRGGHTEALRPYAATPLRTISQQAATAIEIHLRDKTGLPIVSVYKNT